MSLTVTENAEISVFALMDGESYDATSNDGIWLSDKYANANGIKLGDSITFEYIFKFFGFGYSDK